MAQAASKLTAFTTLYSVSTDHTSHTWSMLLWPKWKVEKLKKLRENYVFLPNESERVKDQKSWNQNHCKHCSGSVLSCVLTKKNLKSKKLESSTPIGQNRKPLESDKLKTFELKIKIKLEKSQKDE